MEIQVRPGQNVRRLRKAKSWSQEDYADRAGIHRTYVGDIERGRRNPTATVVEKLARLLEVEPGRLEGTLDMRSSISGLETVVRWNARSLIAL